MSRIQNREAGIGLIGAIFWIVVLAVIVALVVKVGPLYYDNMSLQNILQDQARHASPSESAGEILYNLQDRLNVAMIKINQQDIHIIKNGDAPVQIVVDYDRTVPLVGNISLLIHFHTSS
ncbi:DUF4845 domain-containing protein [Acidithiobacillus sp. YTS05]|nr:DUF4845 domain-containing protein [Igneacidithiobacillus copahuensis]UTV81994.1 DUF4845 domain-containing protein [Acidithiobacillus sp. YTS05]